MQLEHPPIDTVPTPGAWTDRAPDLVGGFLVNWAKRMDRVFPFPIFERIVRFVWNRIHSQQRASLILEVSNCGHTITIQEESAAVATVFNRMPDGTYVNLDDPIRMGTGAAMHYSLRAAGRDALVGAGALVVLESLNMADSTIELELVGGQSDYWLITCELPGLSSLDGPMCE